VGYSTQEKNTMNNVFRKGYAVLGLLISAFLLASALYADKNQVLGEIRLEGATKVEKTSGVWVDRQYVGYLKELKGSKKILLLPGEHVISVREDGYREFTQQVQVEPGQTEVVRVLLQKAVTPPIPAVLSEVKLAVNPSRAAVFVDGLYIGHVREFEGMGRGLLVAPGDHQISIALPGYQDFETNIKPLPHQKVEIKTDLLKRTGPLAPPLVSKEADEATPPMGSPNTATAQTR
jgi:hypothetical protein